MRWFHGFLGILLLSIPSGASENNEPHPAVNIFIRRSAEQIQSPHIVTYRVFEWSQMRGRWIAPDFGYYDTGYGKDQIWFAGAGAVLVQNRHFHWEQEVYFSQEAGPDAHNQRALWIWPVINLNLPARVTAQIAAYPILPLNRSQRAGYQIDRAKLERSIRDHWLVGGGYAGGICADSGWQSYPFLTATRKTRAGNFEVWLQKTPDSTQIQLRYLLIQGEK